MLPSDFTVNGQPFGGGPFRRALDRFAAGIFTADSAAVAEMLPPQLHPLRVTRRRCLLFVYGASYFWDLRGVAPFRSAEVAVIALVTAGTEPAPPAVPLIGGVGGALAERYSVGSYFLEVATTNRVARELYRHMFGLPGFVADVTTQRRPDRDRFTASEDGRRFLDLIVTADVPARQVEDRNRVYGVRDGHLISWMNTDAGATHRAVRRGSAHLRVGTHPAAAKLQQLRVSSTSAMGDLWITGRSEAGDVQGLGPAHRPAEVYAGSDGVAGRFLLSRLEGDLTVVDQGLDDLPFDPTSDLRAAALPPHA